MNKVLVKRLITWFIISIYIFSVTSFLYSIAVKNPKSRNFIILSVMLFIQVMVMISYGNEKSGFHIDEVWQYETSNSNFNYDGEWRDGADKAGTSNFDSVYGAHSYKSLYDNWDASDIIKNILTVPEEEKFDFIRMYKTIETDVHPPLYFTIIHILSSLYPGTISKWFGLVPNIIFFVLGVIVLYKISCNIFEDNMLKWYTVILWCFSVGAITSVVFLRMYVLLTLTALLFVYGYLKYVYDQKITVKTILVMFLLTYLGCISQYYFLVFAFFFTAYECLKRLFLKDYKNMILFGFSVLMGVVMLFITFPNSIYDLFFGARGAQAVEILDITKSKDSNIIEDIVNYIDVVSNQLFADGLLVGILLPYQIFILLFAILFYAVIIYMLNLYVFKIKLVKEEKLKIRCNLRIPLDTKFDIPNTLFLSKLAPIIMSIVSYFIFISIIAPYIVERYVVLTFPLICLLFVYFFDKFIGILKLKYGKIILPIIIFIIISYSSLNIEIDFLYPEHEGYYYVVEENSDIPAIYLPKNDCMYVTLAFPYISQYDNLLISNYYELEEQSLNTKIENMDKIMLHIQSRSRQNSNTIPNDIKLDTIKDFLGYNEIEVLYISDEIVCRLSDPI